MKDKKVIWNIFFFLLASVTAGIITYRIAVDKTTNLDAWAEPFVTDLNEQGPLFVVFRWITELGSASFLVPFALVMAFVLWKLSHNWLAVIFFAAGSALGPYLNKVLKGMVERERPRLLASAEGEGFSFPSGHAMSSMVIYGMLIYFLNIYLKSHSRKVAVTVTFVVLILLIGLSRYMIRVHHLSDVLAGFAYGFIFISIWLGLFSLIYRRRHHHAPSAGTRQEV